MEIEKNIPLPKSRRRPGKPWEDMGVGDSVFFPAIRVETDAKAGSRTRKVEFPMTDDEINKLRARLMAKAKNVWGPRTYKIRLVEKDGVPGLRVWRKA